MPSHVHLHCIDELLEVPCLGELPGSAPSANMPYAMQRFAAPCTLLSLVVVQDQCDN